MSGVDPSREITDKPAGAQPPRSFALLESGLNLIEQGITIFDRDLRLVHANHRFLKLYDLPEDFLRPGTTFEQINRFLAEKGDFGPGNADTLVRERVERALAFEDHYFERTRPNGTVIAVEGHPLARGGWVAVYTDITAQKQHERLLREHADNLSLSLLQRSEELTGANRELNAANRALEEIKRDLTESESRMRTIMRSVPAHIAYIDRDGAYRFTNNRFAHILGHDSEDVVGMKVDDLFEPHVLETLKPAIAAALDGKPNSVEIAPSDRHGEVRHVRTSLVPESADDGTVEGLYVLSLDVTEEKRAMDLLVRSKRMQAAIQLTSGVVHDFSNILTIILGNLNRLSDHALPAAERERIASVTRRAVERGSRVTDQLMSFSRNEELRPAPCNVHRIAADLVRLFSASLDPAVTVSVELAGQPEGGQTGACVDERAFQDALLNLLLNARDAVGHAGTIAVIIGKGRIDGEEIVKVAVRDDGCGFAHGTIEQACHAFFSTKQGGRGRGLGLSMVRRFVRRSGGDLLIESEPGKGAIVTMLLPPAYLEAAAGPAAEDGLAMAQPFGGLALVVDDEPEIRGLVRQYLLAWGAKVIEAAGPDEAFDLVSQIPLVSLVVSDIMMPGNQTGLDMCRRIRTSRPAMPILIMSGLSSAHPALGEAEAEFKVLKKPFGASQFRAAVAASLGAGRGRPGDGPT